MSDERQMPGKYGAKRYESDFAEEQKSTEPLGFSLSERAHRGATPSARQSATHEVRRAPTGSSCELGPPLTIDQVAAMLGCSVWTVRQTYMRKGLPYFRVSHTGKLVFFRDQVIDWIVKQQTLQKGGIPR